MEEWEERDAPKDNPFLWSVHQSHTSLSTSRTENEAIHLYGDFGVKDLLAERAVIEDKGVHVQQVFLQVIY